MVHPEPLRTKTVSVSSRSTSSMRRSMSSSGSGISSSLAGPAFSSVLEWLQLCQGNEENFQSRLSHINTILNSRYSRYLVFCGRSKSSRREDVALIMNKFWFGDWFILMQLCKNMHPEIFHDLVIDLRDR